jgi:6-pyruvoyltetrahydropterin/6-carboxytetrahydropterin synthase
MWEISKEFNFEYGHRVWDQCLNEEFAGTRQTKCRFLHGHSCKVVVHLRADELKDGMITDFHHLNFLKKFLDENLDHKFIIDKNDPLFEQITGLFSEPEAGTPQEEYSKSFYVVDFVPTSENLSQFIFLYAQEKLQALGVQVLRVDWHETAKSKASFIGGQE